LETLRKKAYEEIKRKILFLQLKPGEKISDILLSDELGIGRTPVREALLMLEREKLVKCAGKSGYFVNKLSQEEAQEYLDIRLALELFAIPKMIRGATPNVIRALEQNIRKSEQSAKDVDVHSMAVYNAEFHNIIYQATNSQPFIETISAVLSKLHWLITIALLVSKGSREPIDDHKEIVAALRSQSSKHLETAIRAHLRHATDRCMAMASVLF
jgi:DNA-binding GntR family transcriptional regulator